MDTKAQCAVGILMHNRWDMTCSTLKSISQSDQNKADYDLYIVDNGSSDTTRQQLREWIQKNPLPVKNIFLIPQATIGRAWNLFLSFTKQYPYRVLVENDITFLGTLDAKQSIPEKKRWSMPTPEPKDAGVNPGAIPNVCVIRGPGDRHRPKNHNPAQTSNFVNYLIDFSQKHSADMVACVPVPTGNYFLPVLQSIAEDRFRGDPYLLGGCLLITKKCIDTIGYMDERLPRRVIHDYSQRAINAGLNLGWHDSYWVIHNGWNTPTEGQEESKIATQTAMATLAKGSVKGFLKSEWSIVRDDLQANAKNNVVLNIK